MELKDQPKLLSEALWHSSQKRQPWLCLLLGLLLLPFTFFQTVFPPAGWLAPLFLLRYSRTARQTRAAYWGIRLAYLAALWFANRGLPFSPLGFLGNILLKGLLWSLPYTADRELSRRITAWPRTLVFPLAFTTADWLISLLPISSSGSPAYSQEGNLALLQILAITGMWGVTFLIAWFAALVNALWEQRFAWRPLKGQLILFAALITAAYLYGGLRLAIPAPAASTEVRPAAPAASSGAEVRPAAPVAFSGTEARLAAPAAQPVKAATVTIDAQVAHAAAGAIDWASLNPARSADQAALKPKLAPTVEMMLARSETALRKGAEIVVWQESGAWVFETDKPAVLARAMALAKQYHAALQITLEVFLPKPAMPYLVNQSIFIDPNGSVLWTYNKTYPVPYDEAFATLSGAGRLPLAETPAGRLSAAICYDTYYPALIRQAGQNSVNLFFAPANDVPQFAQSALSISVFRAIENGFTMIRPTGSGLSAMIDDHGRILAQQDYFTSPDGILLATLPIHHTFTLYSRIGDVFAWLCAAGLALIAARVLLSRWLTVGSLSNPLNQARDFKREQTAKNQGVPRP